MVLVHFYHVRQAGYTLCSSVGCSGKTLINFLHAHMHNVRSNRSMVLVLCETVAFFFSTPCAGTLHTVAQSHDAKQDDELTVDRGATVTVIWTADDGWWMVR